MKIALFVHCFFPEHFYGTETYTLELARHYRHWGHEVTVVSADFQGHSGDTGLLTRYRYQDIPVIRINKHPMPNTRIKDTYHQPAMSDVLSRIVDELRPDIIHVTHLINHTAILLEIAGQKKIPTYATFTDFFGFCLNNKLETADGSLCSGPSPSRVNCFACHLKDVGRHAGARPWIRCAANPNWAQSIASLVQFSGKFPGRRRNRINTLIDDIAERPDILSNLYNRVYRAAVAPTRFLADAYRNNGILIPLHNIPFGVDIDRKPKPKRPSGERPVIGFIGQIAPHKGTDLLIEAFRRLPGKSAELWIYGSGSQDRPYMAALTARACGFDVRFKGTFVKESMADVFAGIDLLVIPSRWYENSPLVLLNALATHTPVLVTDVEGMTEFVTDGVNGARFRLGSVDELEEKLKTLIESPDLLESLSGTTHYDRTTETMALDTFHIYAG
ncbi:MAG: glycosyltransferase family 4 protein [Gammaproteobacteria bacterium]